jgi:ABC-type glutathione transport system ATPase component
MIELTGLSAERGGKQILHPTDIRISMGERIGLVGASGSGKSTLGHRLTDCLRVMKLPVAHVTQTPDEALDPLRKLSFHWRQAERALGLEEDVHRRAELFNGLDLPLDALHQRPWAWSRGMQQRFVIAMALIGRPALLIMDEPTSALDPIVAAQTMELLDRQLQAGSTALMLITHDLGLAARRVDRILVMAEGRIVEDAPTAKLLSAPKSREASHLVSHRAWANLPC